MHKKRFKLLKEHVWTVLTILGVFFCLWQVPVSVNAEPCNLNKSKAWLNTPASGRNLVGRSETLQGGGGNDAAFEAIICAPDRKITSMEIRNLDGVYSIWDTLPGNGYWLCGIVVDGKVVNRNDGSINYKLGTGETRFEIYCEDNGSAKGGQTHYKLTIGFASGEQQVINILDYPDPIISDSESNEATAKPMPANSSGTSEWTSNFNKMTLDQKGKNLSGNYDYAGGKMMGILKGRTLEGWWSEDDDVKDCGPDNAWSGPYVLTFADDGKSFTGIYGKCQNAQRSIASLTPSDGDWHGNLSKGAINFNFTQTSEDSIADDNRIRDDLNVDDLIQELKQIISEAENN